VRDLDWLFWALPKLYGRLAYEAQELVRKVRAIKVPKSDKGKLEVEYRYEMGRRFCGFSFVKAGSPPTYPMDDKTAVPRFVVAASPKKV